MPSTIFTDDIPLASLEVVSLAGLERNDEAEIDKLLAASTSAGFLYLDFEGSQAADLPERKQQILDIMKEYFEQPQEVKDKDSKGTMRRGYVNKGTFSGIDPVKQRESFEHLAIGAYDLRTNIPDSLPPLFERRGSFISDYIATCEYVVGKLLASYAKRLGAEDLGHHHDPQRKSDTILALLSYQGQLTHQKHTDLGSLTVLFSDQWGLQVMSPGAAPRWQWVEPRPHQAVINVGDALRFLSGKRLYSSLHRVVKEGRALADATKYSVAYLLRAADDTVFDDVEGVQVTASQLAAAKYGSYAADHDEQEKSQVLCGGMETVLGVRG